ncbi:AmmeMemoRadiSam system radical SAM enzyme [Thermodesulfovibrionales bacterium]|nr:AmmeMemoRadiSam system radical SAM enzyme [Thermodesulfovibrionales bacterium]MCL0086986.1 AmmeMemoRadiSam system radical SAM enzyme [Thermodesulfovibrionales bacterium]
MWKILTPRRKTSNYIFIGIIAISAMVGLGLASAFLWHHAGSPEEERPALLLVGLPEQESIDPLHEAMFFQEMADNKVRCRLCFLNCIIPEGERGICRVRVNHAGRLYTLVHSRVVSWQVMPVEKDTMQHLLPGAKSFAIATASCNLRCKQCHNWRISQAYPEELRYRYWPPEEIVRLALKTGSTFISGTMNEPTIFFEYLYDIFPLAQRAGIKTMFRTNAMINPEPLKAILQYTDAVSLDLKGFCDDFHRRVLRGELQPALDTLKILSDSGVWFEITNLIIPTLNDDMDDIRQMVEWIKENLGPDIPMHFNRFFPAFRLTHLPPTPVRTLEQAYSIARNAGLNFVYIGNVPGHPSNSTFCPGCGTRLVHRTHLAILYNRIVDGRCPDCGHLISGVWE